MEIYLNATSLMVMLAASAMAKVTLEENPTACISCLATWELLMTISDGCVEMAIGLQRI